MFELTPAFFAIAAPAVVFAGISKGGFGSGAAFASASILAVILDPGTALGIMLPLLMLIDMAALRSFWGRWSGPDSRVMLIGGIPGVALGVVIYQLANADVLRFLIGFISVAFVLWHGAQNTGMIAPFRRRLSPGVGVMAGFAAGFTSFVSHAGGPAAAVYLLSQRLDKTRYQATTVLVFWILNIVKFVPYAYLGMFTAKTALAGVLLAPFALLGTWLGVRAHWYVSERLFFGLTYVLLTITGTKLIWDALT